jgi:hypothetical protein
VVEICQPLEGVPLVIELAAARTRLLDPDALLGRLARSLDALGTGAVDLPQRQHTLRATVDWSVGLLDQAERSLLETLAIFVDGWTIQAAAQVAELEEDRAVELSEALVRHSLIQLDRADHGSRARMLETVRAFVAERLAARPDVAAIGRRHADHYRALATQADRPLRGLDQAALATSQRLAALLAGIQDPYLHAVSQLAMAGIAAVVGDLDGALRGELVSLEELRGRDEPYWTTVAVLTAGLVETARGRHDAASATCARRAPWRGGSTTPGWPPGLRCSWASWPW